MRPQAGGGGGGGGGGDGGEVEQQSPSRARKRSSADLGLQPAFASAASNATPTSLLLGSERDVEAYLDGQLAEDAAAFEDPLHPRLSTDSIQDSTYGVRSISESGLVSPLVAAAAAAAASDANMEGNARAGLDMENEEAARFLARRRSTIRPVHASASSSAATNTTATTATTAATRRGSTSGLSSISGYTNETSPSKKSGTGRAFVRDYSNTSLSQPLTPMSHASPGSLSDAPPSPRSSILLHSDDELETGSQAILSSGEEDAGEEGDKDEIRREEEDAVAATGTTGGLQLVMPSLLMPSRRPFTERGKQLGKLKVLLAGASGSGKTSLIKSIIQTCEDVVHIDPQSPSSSQIYTGRSSKRPTSSRPTRDIMEIAGSTKPYPGWWAEVEESQMLRRRRKHKQTALATSETVEAASSDEEVLERNICFVDTPGYDKNSADVLKQMEPVLQYLQAQMAKAISPSAMHDSELLGYLGGAGGSQIDVVLYLFGPEPTSVEVDFYDKLSKLAYVIPLLAKSDLIAGDSLEDARSKLAKALRSTSEQRRQRQRPGTSVTTCPDVFSICSSTSNDLENMDASLLMTSGYVEPLHPSQLPELVDHIFQPQRAAFLKHVAAKKLVAWRYSSPHSMAISPSPLRTNLFASTLPLSSSSTTSSSPSPSSVPAGRQRQAPLSPTSAALTYTSSRLLDHKQREERMAKLHLGHWADSLRRNLAAERMRYEALANADRERWLKDRLDECVFNGSIVQTDDEKCVSGLAQSRPRSRGSGMSGARRRYAAGPSSDELDPLALMKWRRHVLGALQVVGGFSIMSAVALWVVKTWEWEWEWLEEYGVGRLQELLGAPVDGIGAR